MDLTSLNPDVLRELLKLSEQKSSLVKQIEAIDSRIAALSGGKAPAATGKKRGRPAKVKAEKAPNAPKAAKGKRGRPAKAAAAKAEKAPKAARGKRGALKNDILDLLAKAGSEGISVKDISTKLGVKNQNVHVWFSTTGKKMAEIAKVGEARYALVPAASAPAPAEAPSA